MSYELNETPKESDPYIELLGVSPDSLRDPVVAEAYHAKMAGEWADGKPHFIVDASSIGDDGFNIGYFDGKDLTTSIRFSYDEGCEIKIGEYKDDGLRLDEALLLTKVMNHHLSPEARDRLFLGE